jgi:hypothetical protein
MIDPILQIKANLNAFSRFPNARGISNTSGGIGKKDASAVEIRPSAAGPDGFSDQDKTQLYNSLM